MLCNQLLRLEPFNFLAAGTVTMTGHALPTTHLPRPVRQAICRMVIPSMPLNFQNLVTFPRVHFQQLDAGAPPHNSFTKQWVFHPTACWYFQDPDTDHCYRHLKTEATVLSLQLNPDGKKYQPVSDLGNLYRYNFHNYSIWRWTVKPTKWSNLKSTTLIKWAF